MSRATGQRKLTEDSLRATHGETLARFVPSSASSTFRVSRGAASRVSGTGVRNSEVVQMSTKSRSPRTYAAPGTAIAPSHTTTTATTGGFISQHRKPKAKRNRKGWGPFQSVIKERSVDFNLTLDIQSLKQEIQQLTTRRDLLQSRVLQLRHTPTGSLMQIVQEYLRRFRHGFPVERDRYGQRHVVTTGEPLAFLYNIFEHDVHIGSEKYGVSFMVDQFRQYAQLSPSFEMDMTSFEIIVLDDDNVVIVASGTLHLQIEKETIAGFFPSAVGNERLTAKLVGARAAVPSTIRIYFNRESRICGYQPDGDFVAAFSTVLDDVADVAELLGQSAIGEHSTLGTVLPENTSIEEVDY